MRDFKLITFDGIDGAGKSTVICKVKEVLEQGGHSTCTDTLINIMPDIFMEIGNQLQYSELRHAAFTIESNIRFRENIPYYNNHHYVIFDRWYYTDVVYLPPIKWYEDIFKELRGKLPIPDKFFYMEVSLDTAINRLKEKNDWMLKLYDEKVIWHRLRSYQERYEEFFFQNNIEPIRIDANRPIEHVISDVIKNL